MAEFTKSELKQIQKKFYADYPGGKIKKDNIELSEDESFQEYLRMNRDRFEKKLPNRDFAAFRERSLDSEQNEFIFDRLKLAVMLEMALINQPAYEAAIKNPPSAIETLNQKRPLNDRQQAEFEHRLTDKMLEDKAMFQILPPSVLAEQYRRVNEKITQGQSAPEDEVKAEKLASRIDELSQSLYQKQQLFFADVTNISDTYDGYMQMFAVRETYPRQNEDTAGLQRINEENRAYLADLIEDYDREWNLEAVDENAGARLDKRFDELTALLNQTALDEETMQLAANFKFYDEENNPQPQFVDEQGNVSDVYSPGTKIIEGSALETMLRIARQNVLQQQLTESAPATIESLNQAVREELPSVLYAAHVAQQVEQGAKEDPRQFIDPVFLRRFMADLSQEDKPMGVSPSAFQAAVDSCVNHVGAYAHRLGGKIGKNQPVVSKLFEPLKNLDRRAGDRTVTEINKRAVRIEMLKRTAKGAASAFFVSGAITVAATAAAADASLTAATLGANKMAGMAVGSMLAVGMTVRQIRRWRKERKAAGKKRGLGALLKDRRMMMTIGTTALGAAALGFAVTGNPGAAQMLGYSAMAMGTANGVINTFQDSRKSGLGVWEAGGWAVLQTVATVGAGFAGRAAANAGIDAYNAGHADNQLFQHREKIGEHTETTVHTTTETVYKPGVVEQAQKIVEYWYHDNPELLQQHIETINHLNLENGTSVNPYRYLLAAHDAGALTADNHLLHVQDGADVFSQGNHKVLGAGWSQESGISQDTVKILADSVRAEGINLTPDSLQAFEQIDAHISANNQVGHVAGNPHQDDGVLKFNAEIGADGRAAASPDGSQYTTFADHDGVYEQVIREHTSEHIVEDYGLRRNQTDLGLGMFGVLGRKVNGINKLKRRIGSLLDKLSAKKQDPIIPEPPVVIKDPQKLLPEHQQNHLLPEGRKTDGLLPEHQQDRLLPERRKPAGLLPEHTEPAVKKLLDKEYQIVHGIEPDSAEQARYRSLVEKEWTSAGTKLGFGDYLKARMMHFEQTLAESISPLTENTDGFSDTPQGRKHIFKTRQTMWKTNLSQNGKELKSSDVTLLHFEKLVAIGKNSAAHSKLKAAEDRRRTPAAAGKGSRPHGQVYELAVRAASASRR